MLRLICHVKLALSLHLNVTQLILEPAFFIREGKPLFLCKSLFKLLTFTFLFSSSIVIHMSGQLTQADAVHNTGHSSLYWNMTSISLEKVFCYNWLLILWFKS